MCLSFRTWLGIFVVTSYGLGHESLSILFRFAHNLLSVLDHDSTVAKQHVSVFLASPQAKQFACSSRTK